MASRPLPIDVESAAARYLDLADEAFPGRIEALYLVGSTALGDYVPGKSDIDFAAVTSQPFHSTDEARLRRIHTHLQRAVHRPWFDGIYVTWNDLQRDPTTIVRAPHTHEGVFALDRGFEANPSVWLHLARHPLSVRGPAHPAVWHDPAVVRDWNRANLNTYWQSLLAQLKGVRFRLLMAARAAALDGPIEWCVPGPARLHYTIVTGDVVSKSDACDYALRVFPRFAALIEEALALRHGRAPSSRRRQERYHDLLRYMQTIIADGCSRV